MNALNSPSTFRYPSDVTSDIFQVAINGAAIPAVSIPGISSADYQALAEEYRSMPAYCWIERRFIGVHVAQAALAGKAEVVVTVPEPVEHFAIYPRRKQVQASAQGNELRFSVPDAALRYLLIDINDLPMLCLLIDPPETVVPRPDGENVVSLRFFADPGEDWTDPIRTAAVFRRAAQALNGSGKTLVVPAGEYYADTIKIEQRHNFRIYFAPGSIVRTRLSPPGQNEHIHGLWLHDCHDLSITGRGCIDQQGYENFVLNHNNYKHGLLSWAVPNAENPYTTQSPLFITRCQRITVEGLTLRNGRNFNVNIRSSDDVTLRRCKVITPPASNPEFTDGYQINACWNTLLENCFAFCNDDNIASGHYFYSHDDRDSRNFTARGFVGWNARANGIRIGFYTHYNMGDFTFEDCDFIGATNSGFLIHPLYDAPEGDRYPKYGTIRFHNCGVDLCHLLKTGLIHMENIRMDCLELDGVAFDGPAPAPSLIQGHLKDGMGQVVLRNVTIGGEKVTDVTAAGLEIQNARSVRVE